MKVASDDDEYTSRSMQNLFTVSFSQCGKDSSTAWDLNTYDVHPSLVENYLDSRMASVPEVKSFPYKFIYIAQCAIESKLSY